MAKRLLKINPKNSSKKRMNPTNNSYVELQHDLWGTYSVQKLKQTHMNELYKGSTYFLLLEIYKKFRYMLPVWKKCSHLSLVTDLSRLSTTFSKHIVHLGASFILFEKILFDITFKRFEEKHLEKLKYV